MRMHVTPNPDGTVRTAWSLAAPAFGVVFSRLVAAEVGGRADPDKRPLIFCERCGEVRALALPPLEAAMTTQVPALAEADR